MQRHYFLLVLLYVLPTQSQRLHSFKTWATLRDANWSSLLFEPSAFVVKSHVRLRNRPEGYQPGPRCSKYVGMGYLDHIRQSKQTLCTANRAVSTRNTLGSVQAEAAIPASQSSVDCYTAPYVPVGFSNKASISLCRSRNMVLNTCAFYAGRRKGTLNKKFPMPARGAVQLGCTMENYTALAESNTTELGWLKSIHHEVWWSNATRDDRAVEAACSPGAKNLVTTPTLFVMRDRHANYAHEMEVVSMAFSFLAALEPADVAAQGLQVVIVDQAPPTGFLETWARISRPHRLRVLAHDPFPPNTCFRSAYHVYTFAAGIGYNTNGETTSCESPVATGLSHWLRQLYEERDPSVPAELQMAGSHFAAATAGPVAAAAGLRGLRPPTSGLVMKNVVWLSRRNLEMVRLLLNASVGWKSMRMVRNEDEVVAGMLAAVQEWNAESCLLRRFDRDIKKEYEASLSTVNPVHLGPGGGGGDGNDADDGAARRQASESERKERRALRKDRKLFREARESEVGAGEDGGPNAVAGTDPNPDASDPAWNPEMDLEPGAGLDRTLLAVTNSAAWVRSRHEAAAQDVAAGADGEGGAAAVAAAAAAGRAVGGDRSRAAEGGSGSLTGRRRAVLTMKAGDDIDEHGNDDDDEVEQGAAGEEFPAAGEDRGVRKAVKGLDSAKSIAMEDLWADTRGLGSCRRSNVLFTFVDGDFNDMPYHQQLKTIFRTGVLVGVHGAGLTHGFFMPPGQSAVLQLLGESFEKVAANNVFRNMAVGLGNFYEDVLYQGVDVKVPILKQAVKRAMDFVAKEVMDAQLKINAGTLPPLVLDDQSHFSVIVPSPLICARSGAGFVRTQTSVVRGD